MSSDSEKALGSVVAYLVVAARPRHGDIDTLSPAKAQHKLGWNPNKADLTNIARDAQ